MLNLLKALRQDEYGVILSTEIVIIGTLLVIGLITGLTCLQKSVNGELRDLAGAVGSLDQTYSFSGHRKSGYGGQCCAYTAGSAFNNCERDGEHRADIVGCEAPCTVPGTAPANCDSCHHGVGGSCNHCGSNCSQCGSNCSQCAGGSERGSVCGSCGGRAGGCSDCGSGFNSGNGPQCIDTGVPKMKVTEWPSADCSDDTTIPSHQAPIPESGIIIQSNPTTDGEIAPHSQPIPSSEVYSMPIPEARYIPVFPAPAPGHRHRGGSQFVIPSHVW